MEMKAVSVESDKSDLDAQLKQLERDWNRLSIENTDNANCDSVIHNGSDLQKEKVFSSDISVRHSTGDLGRHVIADKNARSQKVDFARVFELLERHSNPVFMTLV